MSDVASDGVGCDGGPWAGCGALGCLRCSRVYCAQKFLGRENHGMYSARASAERERDASTNGSAASVSHSDGSAMANQVSVSWCPALR